MENIAIEVLKMDSQNIEKGKTAVVLILLVLKNAL